MPTQFDTLTVGRAGRFIPALGVGQRLNEKFVVDRDHWQGGSGYLGPMPNADEDGYMEFLVELQRIYSPVNALLELVVNRRDGVVGKEPYWYWTVRRPLKKGEKPTEQEQAKIERANALSTVFWNEKALHSLLKDVVLTLLWAERAGMRFLIPQAFLRQEVEEINGEVRRVGDPFVEVANIEEALAAIAVEHPHPKTFTVWEDAITKAKLAILRYESSGRVHYELSYYDPDTKETVLRVIGAGEDSVDAKKMAGHLTMHEVTHPPYLDDAMRRLQMAVNFAMTLIPHNMGSSSFVETTMLNAQMPGEWEYDKDNKKIPGTFKPGKYRTGPRTRNFVVGVDYEEQTAAGDVTTTIATPSIDHKDPVPIGPVVEGKDALRKELARAGRQEHLFSDSDGEASGLAYEQRRSAFISSLNETATPAVELVRWLIEGSMGFAEDLNQGREVFTDTLRVECQMRLDKGPISPEAETTNWGAAEKNQIPLAEAMSRNGIDDPDATMLEIDAQPWSQVARDKAIAEMVAAWTTAGASLEGALSRVKKIFPDMTDEEIEKLVGPDPETGLEDDIVNPTQPDIGPEAN